MTTPFFSQRTACPTLAAGILATLLAASTHAQVQPQPDDATRSPAPIDPTPAPTDQLTVVLGTKFWGNRWSSWSVRPIASGNGTRQIIEPVGSDTRVSVIPQLSARYGDFMGSLSLMTTTNYSLERQWTASNRGSRSEADANLGYYLTPGLVATVGVKRMEQNFGGKFTWTGPMLGLSATASLTPKVASYFGVGLGAMRAKLGNPDGAGKTSLHSQYVLSEAGLAFPVGNLGLRPLRSGAVTVGYRSQTLTTKGYTLNDTNTPATQTTQDVRDSTQGFTLGLVAVF